MVASTMEKNMLHLKGLSWQKGAIFMDQAEVTYKLEESVHLIKQWEAWIIEKQKEVRMLKKLCQHTFMTGEDAIRDGHCMVCKTEINPKGE